MNEAIFVVLSVLYVSSLAAVDGLFNRLVFREKRKHSYFSKHKKKIYKYWEWKMIGVIFLVFLPIVLPSFLSYFIGGFSLVLLYWIVLLLVPWDMIFGVIVFDDWFGDRPSIALPMLGWMNFSLGKIMLIRFELVFLLAVLRVKLLF